MTWAAQRVNFEELMTKVLTVNAASRSLKLSLLDESSQSRLAQRTLELPRGSIPVTALRSALKGPLAEAEVVAHRVIHGGSRFHMAVVVDADVREALGHLSALAPLHQPLSLAALDAVTKQLPSVPAVACFDTAFHATIPEAAATYALPERWRERWGLRRYGFHGLSHEHVAREVAETVGSGLRIISCHLGASASLCAIAGGRSLDTTMGFTLLDGLVMASRPGSVDPGLLLWLLEQTGLSEREMARMLEEESGLAALAGNSDMRDVLAARAVGDRRAELALAVYFHHLRAGIAAMAATLGGVEVIAFTGGVGESSETVRTEALLGLEFLDARVVTVRTGEDLEMARQARAVLALR
ncbi:MAG: acetate/propionate family kinase [Solirubrobacteraceae bacterium]